MRPFVVFSWLSIGLATGQRNLYWFNEKLLKSFKADGLWVHSLVILPILQFKTTKSIRKNNELSIRDKHYFEFNPYIYQLHLWHKHDIEKWLP